MITGVIIAAAALVWVLIRGKGSQSQAGPAVILPSKKIPFELIDNAGYSAANWSAVSKMETANFTSDLFRKANNLWGMKVARIRPNYQDGAFVSSNSIHWAKYDTVERSVLDIIAWCDYVKFPKGKISIERHVAEMGARGYFGDESTESYLSKVKAWMKR